MTQFDLSGPLHGVIRSAAVLQAERRISRYYSVWQEDLGPSKTQALPNAALDDSNVEQKYHSFF